MNPYIWRLENSQGIGVYATYVAYRADREQAQYWGPNHPGPGDEGLWDYVGSHLFGFDDLADTRAWFWDPADGFIFQRYGIKLAAYERAGAEVVHGRTCRQLVFRSPNPNPVARLPIRRLWTQPDAVLLATVDHLARLQSPPVAA